MKFDSNLAWKQATAAIAANREVLLAMAGVFFLFPSLAFSLLFPQSNAGEAVAPAGDLAPGEALNQALQQIQAAQGEALPWIIPMAIFQAIGTLAILTLFTDHSRPTVGQAIRRGLGGVLTYFGSQIVLAFCVAIIGAILVGLTIASGSAALMALAIVVVIVGVIYAFVKTSLVAPVIAVEGERNPIAALVRSWRLTKGNSMRIAVFYLLLVVAFMVITMIVSVVLGIVMALFAGDAAADTVSAIVSAVIGSGLTLYFVAIIAAIHRQLAGPSPDSISETFE